MYNKHISDRRKKTFEGKDYVLLEEAFPSDLITDHGDFYVAHARDEKGDIYLVKWAIKDFDDGEEPEDGSELCDWDNPVSVEFMEEADEDEEELYMNLDTGSVDTKDGWRYQKEDGTLVDPVELGQVVRVIKDYDGEWILA